MTVSLGHMQAGIVQYINEEFLAKLTGVRKWAVDAVTAVYLAGSADIFERARKHPAVSALNIIDDAGRIDLDKAYKYIKAAAAKGPAVENIPGIGPVTLTEADVDKLYSCIVSAYNSGRTL